MDKFFIVGCPRSGTTMLQQALNRHPRVVIPPETKYFFSFFGQPRRRQVRHLRRLNEDLGIDLPVPARRVASVQEGRDFYEAMARRYVERLGKGSATHFGEKTPEHTGHLPRIGELFPDARVVVLLRDGRDVAASLTGVPWGSPNLYVNFVIWLYYYGVVREAARGGWPNLYFVRYEDIVAEPETQLGEILRFLGLPDDPAVAGGWGNREGIPRREYAWKGMALEKITPARVGAYRRALSPDQVAVLERLGRHALPSLGYELSTDGQAPLSAGFYLKLWFGLAWFAYRLPWHSVFREVSARLFAGWPPGRSEPFPSFRPPRQAGAGPSPGQPCCAVEGVGSDHGSRWGLAVCPPPGADGRRLPACLED